MRDPPKGGRGQGAEGREHRAQSTGHRAQGTGIGHRRLVVGNVGWLIR